MLNRLLAIIAPAKDDANLNGRRKSYSESKSVDVEEASRQSQGGGKRDRPPVPDDKTDDDPADPPPESKDPEMAANEERKRYVVSKEPLLVDPRYKPKKKLGQGAYGVVVSAVDEANGDRRVAIKKIRDAYHNVNDAKRILREIRLMQHFHHPNVLELLDIINPRSKEEAEDIYLVLPFVQTDLNKLIQSATDYTESHVALMGYQLLLGLRALHAARVIHRDLKPSNILVNAECEVRICDFGLARGCSTASASSAAASPAEDLDVDEDPAAAAAAAAADADVEFDEKMTEYVVTRWYRAPEVTLSPGRYGYGIDVWAVGCILAELFRREILFPGKNYINQLDLIFGVIGTPADEVLRAVCTNEKAMKHVNQFPRRAARPLTEVCPGASEDALDLIGRMLTFNPETRISVEDALRHPFFTQFFNAADLECMAEIEPFDMEFDKLAINKRAVQNLIFREVQRFRPRARNPLRESVSRSSA